MCEVRIRDSRGRETPTQCRVSLQSSTREHVVCRGQIREAIVGEIRRAGPAEATASDQHR